MISHPEKLLYPADGISKGEVADYYQWVAPLMLPHLRDRPVTMERFPAGIEQKGFMQKDVSKGFPEWLKRLEVQKQGGSLHHPLINDVDSLLWLANQNCITPHVWSARHPHLQTPDLCLFDLDPSRDDLEELRAAALCVRELLGELALESWLKTSGSKGFHIVVPLSGQDDYERVWSFAHAVGALLVKRHPARFTQEFIKADRGDRILVDTGRNGYGATFAATYALRPKPGAPISAPCSWQELSTGTIQPQSVTLRNVRTRIDQHGNLWEKLHEKPYCLENAYQQVREQLSEEEWNESLVASTRRPKARKRTAPRKG